MRTAKKLTGTVCPKCGANSNIVGYGFNRLGRTQRCKCKHCGKVYTQNPKAHEYPKEVKEQAIKVLYSSMSKANVYRWLKKPETMWISPTTDF